MENCVDRVRKKDTRHFVQQYKIPAIFEVLIVSGLPLTSTVSTAVRFVAGALTVQHSTVFHVVIDACGMYAQTLRPKKMCPVNSVCYENIYVKVEQ